MVMDFFEHQQVARQRTSLLVGYFVLAVILITLAVYTVTSLVVVAGEGESANHLAFWDWGRFAIVSFCTGLIIGLGSLYKSASLRAGGSVVAEMLGGTLVDPSQAGRAERRLLNVVEEMAIASGTPVPSVFILREESSINAFAAGHDPSDAVIAVSQGALDHLNRDELQGVIAHEFSHILNGDMRLNLRLIGLLHGILLIALIGYTLFRVMGESNRYRTRSRDRDDDKGKGIGVALFFMGLGLMIVGYVGVFFGRLIKSAISRQREFLADASAVQFTRNPGGIGGALKKIGGLETGSMIRNENAEQACHMFFGPGVSFWTEALATHPPLAERIRRIDPTFDGTFPAIPLDQTVSVPDDHLSESTVSELASNLHAPSSARSVAGTRVEVNRANPSREIPLDAGQALASVGAPTAKHVEYASALLDALPQELAEAVHEPFAARAVIFALLLDQDPTIQQNQIEIIAQRSEPGTAEEVLKFASLAHQIDDRARMPLAELAMPALRQLSLSQYRSFRDCIEPLIRADQRRSLFEFALQRMLIRHLDRRFNPEAPTPVRYRSLSQVLVDCIRVLSTIARLGESDEQTISRTFSVGAQTLNLPPESTQLAPLAECTMVAIDHSLDRLGQASPAIKKQFLNACASSIAVDGVVSVAEAELLRAIADALDCPMPPIMN